MSFLKDLTDIQNGIKEEQSNITREQASLADMKEDYVALEAALSKLVYDFRVKYALVDEELCCE